MKYPVDVKQGVRHARFGLGTTVRSDSHRTSIEFEDHGIKTFVTSMLEVELVDEQPAPRTRRASSKTAR